MKQLIIPSIALLVWATAVYAMTPSYTPSELAEKQNKEAIETCIKSISYQDSYDQIQRAIETCGKEEIIKVITPKVEKSTTSGSEIPVASQSWSKTVSVECEFWTIERIEWIEYHYTATDEQTTLQSLKNSHISRGMEHIWYHYVIKPSWEVINTRDEKCIAWADKWSRNNYRFIQIAFIGDDKPTREQFEKMAELTHDIQIRYKLPIDSISAHSEWWPKSKKESLEYWFWSKEEFIKKIRYYYVISIYGNWSVELQYMWRAWWDLDFISTIFSESRFNNNSVWDGGNSIWYCQIHQLYQPWWYQEYKQLSTMEERLNYCHEKYTYAKWLKGGVWSRFHWYEVREKHKTNITLE